MVRYSDPEECVDARAPKDRARVSPAEKMAQLREKNAALTGVQAIEAAREIALRRLDQRACSTAELRTAMTSRGFSEDVADEVLGRLERVGLVDDVAYARAVVAARFGGSGKVGRALVEDLRRKGLSSAVIDEALAGLDADDEYERARELVARKRRSLAGLDRQVMYRRLSGMLARKGYSGSVVNRVISEAIEEWKAEGEDGYV